MGWEGGRKEGGLPAFSCTDTPHSTCLLGCKQGALWGLTHQPQVAVPLRIGFWLCPLQYMGERGQGIELGWAAAASTQKGRHLNCGNSLSSSGHSGKPWDLPSVSHESNLHGCIPEVWTETE